MPETEGTAAVVDHSPSLADFVGDIHGDFLQTAEPDSPAGAPPAANPETPASEGAEAAVADGQTPATAETVPDPNAQAPESDPLEGSSPMSYVVNGESRTFEGITRLKDGGAIVDPEAVALLERRLGERDHLFETSRAQHEQLEHFGKLTEWHVRDPATGQTRTLTGREGVEAQRLEMGRFGVEAQILKAVINDPQKLAGLLLFDEQNGITINRDALEALGTRIENAQLKAAQQVRASMARYAATQAPAAPAQTFDAATFAAEAVDVAIKSVNATGLTAEDKQFLESQASRYIRQATPADAQKDPTFRVGQPILDGGFAAVVKDRAQLRASAATQVTAASEAAKRNAAVIQAANAGKKPAPKPAATTTPHPTEPSDREKAEDDNFFATMRTGAAIMRQPQGAS